MELFGGTEFPVVTDQHYLFTLGPKRFLLVLSRSAARRGHCKFGRAAHLSTVPLTVSARGRSSGASSGRADAGPHLAARAFQPALVPGQAPAHPRCRRSGHHPGPEGFLLLSFWSASITSRASRKLYGLALALALGEKAERVRRDIRGCHPTEVTNGERRTRHRLRRHVGQRFLQRPARRRRTPAQVPWRAR